jgi:hypothetical protein
MSLHLFMNLIHRSYGWRSLGRNRSNFGHAQKVPFEYFDLGDSRAKTWRAPGGIPPGALKSRQPACKPGSGRPASNARRRDDHSSGTPVARRLKQPTRTAGSGHDPETRSRELRAVPIRSCSRWGLPCRRRYRRRGALLPHRFTLAAANTTHRGGLFSVALSLGSHPPDVIRHRLSMEPGLSSPATFRFCRSGRPAD